MPERGQNSRAAVVALAIAVFVSACAPTAPPRPALELPVAGAKAPEALDRWWLLFDDLRLTGLIEEALANNLEWRTAMARIDEARVNVRLARASLFPSLDATIDARRARRSEATTFRQGPPFTSTTHAVGLAAAYEVDLWGRLSAGQNAAEAGLAVARYDAQTVRIVLAAQVATAYFTLRGADAERALIGATLATRQENVRLQRERRKAGVISALELKQAEAELASVAATIPQLERAIATAQSALAVLAGRSPREVYSSTVARGADLETYATTPEVPPGLPSDLLERRPDVRRAEAGLTAADYRVAEVRAQYFPSLILTASFGSESSRLADLFTSPATIWSIAGALTQPIIGQRRIEAQVDAARARRQQAEIQYVQVVQAAFRDVHDALVAHRAARDAFVAQEQRRTELKELLRLAEVRHRSGYSSYLEVLDAQRALHAAERERLAALRDRQIGLVDLYKALGGGWTPRDFTQASTDAPTPLSAHVSEPISALPR